MANMPEPKEARNTDPASEKSSEQQKRVEEQLKDLSLDDYLSLAEKEQDDYTRACVAREICKKLDDIDHRERIDKLRTLIQNENNEWVYNDYLEFLSRTHPDHDDVAAYHDQLDLLKEFAINDASELKRWLSMYALVRVKAKYRPPWFTQFVKDRILSDQSNWLRAKTVGEIAYGSIHNFDETLTQFAIQWALHTQCSSYPSYHRVKKDPNYFSNPRALLNRDTETSKGSNKRTGDNAGDVRKKYISALKEDKDSWLPWLAFVLYGIGVFFGFVIVDGSPEGIQWLGVFGLPILALGAVMDPIEKLVGTEKKLQRNSDEMLELLYNEMTRKKQFKQLTSKIVSAIVAVGIGIVLFLAFTSEKENVVKRFWSHFATDAKCSIVSTNARSDVFLGSNDPNYGIVVYTTLKNTGKAGDVFVNAELSSSEGDLKKQQKIHIEAGESRQLKFQFIEPTINATDIKYSVGCSPKS